MVCSGREAKIISCIKRRMASPALRRRNLDVGAGGTCSLVGGKMLMLMRGNSRRGCLPDMREK